MGKTFAEILPEEKFAVSHRGAAFRKLLDYLCAPGQ
jgi:inosine/xanthosine triphosphate pyrophosphatase family protein